MSEDSETYNRNKPITQELDNYEFNKCIDKIIHSAEMMAWNINRKETELDIKIAGVRAWYNDITDNINKIEAMFEKLE
jgi:hypothetical protein